MNLRHMFLYFPFDHGSLHHMFLFPSKIVLWENDVSMIKNVIESVKITNK